MRNTELYPELNHNRTLVRQLTAFFAVQPSVYEISIFGSLAADTADRWSEVDLIVVTVHEVDQLALFMKLRDELPVIYHRPFLRDTHVPGAYVSGILLEDASPFHLVNLHFLTLAEREDPAALARYRGLRKLHQMLTIPFPPPPLLDDTPPPEAETVEEARIYDAANALRRALRRVLRRHMETTALTEPLGVVEDLLAAYPDGLPSPHGDVCVLAARYSKMAEMVINAEHENDA